MEKQLSFVLKLSLEEMALRRVVVNLWTEADVLDSIKDFRINKLPDEEYREPSQILLDKQNDEWRATIENEVKAKMAELVLPESLKKRMMHIVRPIGLQIKDWKIFMEAYLSDSGKYLDMRVLEQLCWTSAGAIDYQKTVEKIVRLEKFDVVTRYKLACSFCLADSIPVLWEEVSEDYKRCFRDETNLMRYFDMPMEFYWNYVLKGKEYKLKDIFERFYPSRNLTFHQYAFVRSACQGNKAATVYFFQKLTYKERDDCLIRAAYDVVVKRCNPNIRLEPFKFPQRNLSDVLYYLLSVMSPEQQMQIFKIHSVYVLPCFLDWPWHDLLLDIADLVWTFLPEIKYSYLAHYIHRNLRNEGCYFPNLIQKFLLRSPSYFRKLFLWDFHSWFSEFSYAEDTETIKVIFRNTDLEDRAQLVSRNCFLQLLKGLMKTEKWHLVEQCLREAALSKEDRERPRDALDRYVLENFEGEVLRHIRSKLKRCFELLDETEASAPNMRSSEINH
ncbi:hypothetical protein AVEN_48627-1 [Araneus ventricosus]|uniref:Uncharacterized protein n=1 Tax=Araneus ventricosus TaxID=182803 RepID=A0A4Y2IXY7_ARAVE|nr:hypothetical protein AVEN_48627-1 [Araneus ventricosus]